MSLMGAYGRHEKIAALRAEAGPGRDGLSAGALVRLLRSRGFETKVLRAANSEALATLKRPAILFWQNYHWVVLERVDSDRITIVDPAYGRRVIDITELTESFSGIIVDAIPGPSFLRAAPQPLRSWRSLPLKMPPAARIVAAALLASASYAITLGVPWLTQVTIDAFTTPGSVSAPTVIGGVALAALAFYIIAVARTFVFSRIVSVLGFHLMSGIFERLLRLPFAYFATRPTGELIFRLTSANAVRDLLSTRLVQLVVDLGTLVTITAYLAVLALPIAALALVLLVGTGVLLVTTSRAVTTKIDAELASSSKSQILQLDAISAIAGVKMAASSDRVLGQWREHYAETMQATESRMRLQQGTVGSAISAVQIFTPIALLVAALGLTTSGQLSFGQAVAVQSAGVVLFGVVSSLYAAYVDIARTSRSVERLTDITESAPERRGGRTPTGATGDLELRNLSFRYSPGSPPALEDVSARIRAGAVTAVVGASGSGKSTLAGLLCTLYEPTSGAVLIGGEDVAELDLDTIRSRIGYVAQDSVLLNGTILANLTMGTALTEHPEEVERRCRLMRFLDFVDDLPMGYRTIVSDLGGNLSGGQRQRIAIARVLLSDPDILVLDEATSALDARNERLVSEHLAGLGCTRVVIAHRETTVRLADDILVFDRGHLVQRGRHDDLIEELGAYRALYGNQTDAPSPSF